MKLRLVFVGLVAFAACAAFVACGGKHGNGTDGGGSGGPTIDASDPCGVFGTPCSAGASCCSGVCDNTGSCTVNQGTSCTAAGASCAANTDCCTVSCVGNVCQANQCTGDGGTCTDGGQCCGGTCNNGTCSALNTSCKTDGNPCAGNGDCCSGLCNASGTCGPSSYCTQNGDACGHDAECCGGICSIAMGATLGTCTQPMTGATNCSAGIDGSTCNGCGDCCSALCEPYGPTGVKICQPAEGCRVDGDLCHSSSDCCGAPGTGLPGDGNVQCLKQSATDATGVCRNPTGCNPEGDVCHFKAYSSCGNSSKRDDCCAAPGNSGVCQLDALGVPRCYGLGTSCQMAGQNCAFATDCCDGAPCVPNGQGQLVCGANQCQMSGDMCTNDSDCCDGSSCIYGNGQTYGTCGGGGSGSGSGSGSNTCAQYGQSCTMDSDCCNGVTCGAIDPTTGTFTDCSAGGISSCTCVEQIIIQ